MAQAFDPLSMARFPLMVRSGSLTTSDGCSKAMPSSSGLNSSRVLSLTSFLRTTDDCGAGGDLTSIVEASLPRPSAAST